jgi:hypothetical protein
MSQVGNYSLCIYQGQTFTRIFVWTAGPGSAGALPNSTPPVGSSPLPVDLTGYTAIMQFRPFALSTDLMYDASADITLGGTAGTITLIIPSTVTETFTWFNGVYDLFLFDSSGNATPLLAGSVTITSNVSAVP